MGGMVATKLAAAHPQRVRSLALVSVTGGGSQVLPRSWKALKYAVKVWWSIWFGLLVVHPYFISMPV